MASEPIRPFVRTITRSGTSLVVASGLIYAVTTALTGDDFPPDAVYLLLLALVALGLLCLVVAGFCGRAPFWQDEGRARDGWAAWALMAVPVLFAYGLASLPLLGSSEDLWWTPLGIAVVCGVASVRAYSLPLAAALGAVTAFLLWASSVTASLIWLHGFLTVGLIGLVVLLFRTRTTWGWLANLAGLLVGVLLWLYLGLFALIIVDCETGGACILA
ncbi:hypothetical protein F0U44_10935 [Nocardioides humilatus]|uniref:Uncharacterized protein n=1 Tax=Nocardioides humilatus TaxID=2607660 RepID=A0A5B1LE22_9ACTN|nr:hypothetical protein [Nocardioides humilatus]KAA1418973.1 hypothetical protein F0U44_10935 [Nocardioides humilatus]